MEAELSKALDECLARISKGETIEAGLAQYPELRQQLQPLLYTALSVADIPKPSPSEEFRQTSRRRLMARLRERSIQAQAFKWRQAIALADSLGMVGRTLVRATTQPRRVAIPVILAVLLALGGGLFLSGTLSLFAPSPALASQCTLSVLSGSVEVQDPGSDTWEEAEDGITLVTGSRIKTGLNSHALLTFFEGTTVKLEPDTEVTVQQLESSEGEPTEIVLKQWLGKTWSRVVKMSNPGPRYEIQTPSAYAVVRGTLFVTEVDETGLTIVQTIEGLVSVGAQDQEVYLPAGHEVGVELGAPPSQPVPAPPADSEFIVTVSMPAVALVVDPTGSATGYLPSGLAFNQILGSQSSSPAEGPQVITVPWPVAGEYIVVLRCIAEGTAYFSIEGICNGETVFEQAGALEVTDGSEWLICIQLDVEDGQLIGASVGDVQPLTGQAPENLVVTELTLDVATPIKPPGLGPEGTGPPGWWEVIHPGEGPDGEGPPGWSGGEHPGKGPEGKGPPGWSGEGPPGPPEHAGPPDDAGPPDGGGQGNGQGGGQGNGGGDDQGKDGDDQGEDGDDQGEDGDDQGEDEDD